MFDLTHLTSADIYGLIALVYIVGICVHVAMQNVRNPDAKTRWTDAILWPLFRR